MRAEALGFNKEFLEMVEGAREKYSLLQKEIVGIEHITLDEWILKNIEEVDDNLFEGWTDREKYLFTYALAGTKIMSYFEKM